MFSIKATSIFHQLPVYVLRNKSYPYGSSKIIVKNVHYSIVWNFICIQIAKWNQACTDRDIRISPSQPVFFFDVMNMCENIHIGHCVSLYQHLLKQYHQLLRTFKLYLPMFLLYFPNPPHFSIPISWKRESQRKLRTSFNIFNIESEIM